MLCRYKKRPVPACPIRGTESLARHCCIKNKKPQHFRFYIRSAVAKGNTAQRLRYRYAVRFFVRLPKFTAGILTYFKINLGDMTENLQVDVPQSSQAVFVRCCLNASIEVRDHDVPLNYSLSDHTPKRRVHYPVQVCQAFCPYKEALRYLLPCCLFHRTFQVPCLMRRALCALTRNSFEW